MNDRQEALAALAALRARGVDRWDAPSLAYVEGLVDRDPIRAQVAATRLGERFDQAKRTAASAIEASSLAPSTRTELAGELESGGAIDVLIACARTSLARPRDEQVRAEWLDELRARAARRGLFLEGDDARGASTIVSAMLGETLLSARATATLTRAEASMHEPSGPYNPAALAATLLARIDAASPSYARAIVAMLEDLASATARLAPATKTSSRSKPPEPRRGATRSR